MSNLKIQKPWRPKKWYHCIELLTSELILLAALKRQFELINKYHYCIRNTFFHNNGCWEPCILAKICVIFKSFKDQLLVGQQYVELILYVVRWTNQLFTYFCHIFGSKYCISDLTVSLELP